MLLPPLSQGFEWNKYNQTHYDTDNPPPKIVQGYKFNVSHYDYNKNEKTRGGGIKKMKKPGKKTKKPGKKTKKPGKKMKKPGKIIMYFTVWSTKLIMYNNNYTV